jgi:hypothetical protein
LDDRKDEECDNGGTGEAVNDSDNDWSNGSIAFHAAENAIETRGRNGFRAVFLVCHAVERLNQLLYPSQTLLDLPVLRFVCHGFLFQAGTEHRNKSRVKFSAHDRTESS